jgi:hypothetical protein
MGIGRGISVDVLAVISGRVSPSPGDVMVCAVEATRFFQYDDTEVSVRQRWEGLTVRFGTCYPFKLIRAA